MSELVQIVLLLHASGTYKMPTMGSTPAYANDAKKFFL